MKWIKREHPSYKECEKYSKDLNMRISKWQWVDRELDWNYSIIYPRPSLKGFERTAQYELYDGSDIYIFDTLAGAKAKAYELKKLTK